MLLKQIDGRINVHNSELRKVADQHYSAFMEGIHDIVDIRERIIHLKVSVFKYFVSFWVHVSSID